MQEKQSTMTLEERFAQIDDIIRKMESGEIGLDQTFELYKEGLTQVKEANTMLDTMEKAMLVLNGNGELEEF